MNVSRFRKLTTNHFAINVGSSLREICRPLKTLGIHYFAYSRHYVHGSVHLNSRSDFLEYFYNNKIAWVAPQEINRFFADGCYLYSDIDPNWLPKEHDFLLNEKFRLKEFLFLIQNYEDHIEVTTFGYQHHRILDISLNITLCSQFRQYFIKHADDLIAKATKPENLLHIQPMKFKNSQEQMKKMRCEISKTFLESIKKETPILTVENENVVLSQREFQCLQSLSKGKSLKETAAFLGISPKTACWHFSRLKEKTKIYTKSHLIDLFRSQQADTLIRV